MSSHNTENQIIETYLLAIEAGSPRSPATEKHIFEILLERKDMNTLIKMLKAGLLDPKHVIESGQPLLIEEVLSLSSIPEIKRWLFDLAQKYDLKPYQALANAVLKRFAQNSDMVDEVRILDEFVESGLSWDEYTTQVQKAYF